MKYRLELRLTESDGDEDPHELKSLCIFEGSSKDVSLIEMGALFTKYEYLLMRRLRESPSDT
jgi:hypothetical protein